MRSCNTAGSRNFYNEHILWADLTQFAKTCYCCEVLLRGITGYLEKRAIELTRVSELSLKFLYASWEGDLKDCDNDVVCQLDDGSQLTIQWFTLEDENCPCPDAWDDVPMSARTSRSTESDEAFEKANGWLQDCMSSKHEFCPPPLTTKLPTRVVNVGRHDGIIKLIETNGRADKYVCLSHCWGLQQIFMTTKATIEDRQHEINPTDLSKTFMEAIEVTRRLQIDYVWIDSLCIIQDDALDWERESAQMASIYRNACLTIAGTKSSGGSGGLFTITPDFEVSGTTPSGEDYYLIFREKTDHELAVPGRQNAAQFPLMTRAWVYQERLLSPRVLHFGHYELFYECLSDELCECTGIGYLGVSDEVPLTSPKVMYASALDSELVGADERWADYAEYYLARIWRSMVVHYTSLNLTKTSDRLPALSGIARDTARERKSRYLAGLWEDSLMDDLLWVTYSCAKPRPAAWLAPSWSWVSIDHGVQYTDSVVYWDIDLWREEKEQCATFASIEHCECTSAGLDEFGQVESGSLSISGPVVLGVVERTSDDHGKFKYQVRFSKDVALPFWPDYALETSGSSQVLAGAGVVCLRMIRELDRKRDISLILQASPNTPDAFERIGILHIYAERHEVDPAPEIFSMAITQTLMVV
ncbi:HET domain-containing protein [Pseudomassariella vexata]|uniref:HET domain-containing protein n=1 Tax=Pseudomassariella vexata TaxID=1141098 RepID=A0A1Y2DS44_9PEZI|nr:HET domain-containing protein [Pseudomassariella vexata]ORY62100.1 HET domain-containing protein [Pseudomassariella vexata]